jgi:ferredoxin
MSEGITRRGLFKGAFSVVAASVLPRSMAQAKAIPSKGNYSAVLVDITRCIGCRACLRGCQRANDLSAPQDLMDMEHANTRLVPTYQQWTVVNREGGGDHSFPKCEEPVHALFGTRVCFRLSCGGFAPNRAGPHYLSRESMHWVSVLHDRLSVRGPPV